MPDDLPTQLSAALADRYRIERELGRGGMAVVYLAEDRKLERRVALKMLRPELAASLGAERFLREIAIAAKLSHPNILALHDSGRIAAAQGAGAPDVLYYTMPYVDGESLRDRLEREPPLSLEEALGIAREVADALDYAHGAGVVHRDIKPGNVLLQSGHAVVSDFGIARAVMQAGGEELTETGLAVGTPTYMSPEQALGHTELDGRTDVYALGCVLWEMLAGAPPYTGPTPQAVLAGHSLRPIPRLSRTRRALPRALDTVLTTALAKEPVDRYATAGEMGRALKQVELGEATAVGRATLRREVALLAGVSALALGAVLYVVLGSGLPYWLLAAAAVPLLLEAPFVSGAVRRLRQPGSTSGGHARVMRGLRAVALGGTAVVVALGVGSSATVALGRAGIGPLSTLVSRGALSEHPLLVVADFEAPADDPVLGPTIAGSLRDYWVEAEAFEVVNQARMREFLLVMQRDPRSPVDWAVAEDIAERVGAEAIVAGSIERMGSAYELAARVIAVPSREQLHAERASAEGSLLEARDRLAGRLMRALGEPLAAVRRRPAPMEVSTSSLEALRLFEAQRSVWMDNRPEAERMLRDAITLDPEFAMARWMLAKYLTFSQEYRQAREQMRIACEQRERMVLERFDRDQLQLHCLRWVDGAREQARRWAGAMRERYPDSVQVVYTNMLMWDGDWEGAAESGRADLQLYREILERQGGPHSEEDEFVLDIITNNLLEALLATSQFSAVDSLAPTGYWLYRAVYAAREYDRAAALLDSMADGAPTRERSARLALATGRLARADQQLDTFDTGWATRDLMHMQLWYRGDTAAARGTLETFTASRDPTGGDEVGYLWLARWWADTNQPERAQQLIREYEERYPPDTRDRLFQYGHARAALALIEGEPLRAVALYRESYEYRSTEATWDDGWDTYFHIGHAFETALLPDSAIGAYERAIAHPGSPNDYLVFPLATERLAELYDARGDTANAVEHYRMLAHVWKDADLELQPRVRHARERMRALSGTL